MNYYNLSEKRTSLNSKRFNTHGQAAYVARRLFLLENLLLKTLDDSYLHFQ